VSYYSRKVFQLIFSLLGVIPGILRLAQQEGRWLYSKHRYPKVTFFPGCNTDEHCRFGENVIVYGNTMLSNTDVGDHSYIGGDSILSNCQIGKYCSIASQVYIGLGIHPTRNVISTYPGFYSSAALKNKSGICSFYTDVSRKEYEQVCIGNDVWIGTRVTILDGVTVGDGAIIGAGSVVTKNIEPYSVVVGVPSKMIRKRFTDEQIQKLLRFAWWDKGDEFCREYGPKFLDEDDFFKEIT
jgi:virginiamycin A acetyltransferase